MKKCAKCGYELTAFENECPKCSPASRPPSTRPTAVKMVPKTGGDVPKIKPQPSLSSNPFKVSKFGFGLVGLGVLGVLYFIVFVASPRNVTPFASASVTSTSLAEFTNSDGRKFQMAMLNWRNTGTAPVRSVFASITAYDAKNQLVYRVNDYCIYAVSSDQEGTAPGEEYREPAGEGFLLLPEGYPGYTGTEAVRCEADIIRYSSEGLK